MASTGSPGTRWMSRKTPSVTRNNTGTVATRRRRTRPPIRSARGFQPDILEAQHAVRHGRVPLHCGAERFRLNWMNDEHTRCFVVQDLDRLAVQLLPLRMVADLAGLFEQLIELRVGDARPVE